MKKIICHLRTEDVQNLLLLYSNKHTLITLYDILKTQKRKNDLEIITQKIDEYSKKIECYKNDLFIRYDVPYYISAKLEIDIEKELIYVIE